MGIGSSSPCARIVCGLFIAFAIAASAHARTPLTVAYAGSMGPVMDKALGPAFDQAHDTTFQGIGEGSFGLAHLIASGQVRADVFVAITPGPVEILQRAGRLATAVPIASTEMVIAYSPDSRFAAAFAAAARGQGAPWYEVLERPGVRFGRTDPRTDPQGRNIVLAMQLAARYYGQPDLVQRILGTLDNPRQIFSEPSLLSRLQSGQLDAASAYLSAATSHHLPYIRLPEQVNLGDPALAGNWYRHAGFELMAQAGKRDPVRAQPLVFYAGVLTNARHPGLAAQFVAFLQSAAGRAMLARHGYGKPRGAPLEPER